MGNARLRANGGDLTGERLPQAEGSPDRLASPLPGAHTAAGPQGWGWRSQGGQSGGASMAGEKDWPCPQAQAPLRQDGQGLSPEQPTGPRHGSPAAPAPAHPHTAPPPCHNQGLNVSPLAGDCACSGLSSVPPKFMSTQNLRCDLTQRVLAHVRVETSPHRVRVGAGVSVLVRDRRGHRWTRGRRSCEDGGSGWEGGAASQGHGGGRSPRTLGEARQDPSLLPSEGAGPLNFRVLACGSSREYTPVVLRAPSWR